MLNVLIKLFSELYFHKPDIVYFQLSHHGISFFRDFFFVLIMKTHKIKILFHLHGIGIKQKSNLKKIFYKICFNNEEIICLSRLLSNDIEDVYNGNPFFVPNGIPKINIKPESKENNKPLDIIFLSNLFISKGILDFLEAMKILNLKHINFNATIVGAEGNQNNSSCISVNTIKKLLKENNLEYKVHFLGPKYGNDKYRILQNADIFCYPTHNDAFPLVILEAMQFGLPVISTKEGAISEIINDGETGFIVDKNSPEQIVKKLQILIKNPELKKKMGEAGRKKFIENYTIEKFENNLINILDNVLYD